MPERRRFRVQQSYDAASHQEKLTVEQTQKVEGQVGIFEVPIEVEITTPSGKKSYPIKVSKAEETFTFPADCAPLMVLFDKGNKILKSVDFNKPLVEWIYQLDHADAVTDRADAAMALVDLERMIPRWQRSAEPLRMTHSGECEFKRCNRLAAVIHQARRRQLSRR